MKSAKNAQVTLEFIIMVMAGIAFTIALIVIAVQLTESTFAVQQDEELEDLAKSIQTEIILATQVETGYHRKLYIPTTARGQSYTLTNTNNTITLKGVNTPQLILDIPLINGTLVKGLNVITNENGAINIQ